MTSDLLTRRLNAIEAKLDLLVVRFDGQGLPKPVLMSAKEVADYLDMHVETVRKYHRTGLLRHARGHRNPLKFDITEVNRFRKGEACA